MAHCAGRFPILQSVRRGLHTAASPKPSPSRLCARGIAGAAAHAAPEDKKTLLTFDALESAVRSELEKSAAERRIAIKTLPRLSAILGGLRPGELTVFTGPTGCGKTTVLSQISLDYAMQGVRVLWGSFEIRNTRLARVMLQQVAMQPLCDESAGAARVIEPVYEAAAARLRAAPIHFMDFFGSTSVHDVLGAMVAAFEAPGAPRPHLVVLDNLQFMLSGQAAGSIDRWELMDRAVAALRAFCNRYPVHVMLVVHPRKELDDTELGIASVSGTAKATQEADNVVILQKIGQRRFLDVRKNRFHGELGSVQIEFVPAARMVAESAPEDARSPRDAAKDASLPPASA